MKFTRLLNSTFMLLLSFVAISCSSTENIAYFKDAGTRQTATQQAVNNYIPKVQANDILSIEISSLSPEATEMFNPKSAAGNANSLELRQIDGYLVDKTGNVELPIIGTIKVDGLTTDEVSDLVKSRLTNYLKDPTVKVKFLNFKISVMGEVARPNVYNIANEKVTITEALSMAGDVTIYGLRENVLLIREENGVRQFARINLNKTDVFTSPYYYLHKGDVIYVEPGPRKVYASENRTYQVLTILVGLLNVAAIYAIK
ncbi:polysaccharide biosynthesis/export family protein [Solitalea sp. MAHUQ-68]|uniref:Polysaccharide biosynthesis/export family protein n=1 Tax=Solitalea agri TaxID=2953739 RepID=A0A9X2F2R2_9SPHI|nr:polysaccharide biosynthesis/export family protein [Solitalea agri]MCO4293642.1 polysaccharide biosynthesis/export family protein [Solitalea agri]